MLGKSPNQQRAFPNTKLLLKIDVRILWPSEDELTCYSHIFEEQDLSLSSGIFHVDRTLSLIEGHGKVWKTHWTRIKPLINTSILGGVKSFLYIISVSFIIFNKQHQHSSLSPHFFEIEILYQGFCIWSPGRYHFSDWDLHWSEVHPPKAFSKVMELLSWNFCWASDSWNLETSWLGFGTHPFGNPYAHVKLEKISPPKIGGWKHVFFFRNHHLYALNLDRLDLFMTKGPPEPPQKMGHIFYPPKTHLTIWS